MRISPGDSVSVTQAEPSPPRELQTARLGQEVGMLLCLEPNLHRGVNDPFGKFYEIYRGKQVQCLSYFSPENVAIYMYVYMLNLS